MTEEECLSEDEIEKSGDHESIDSESDGSSSSSDYSSSSEHDSDSDISQQELDDGTEMEQLMREVTNNYNEIYATLYTNTEAQQLDTAEEEAYG
ncbi:predicted protein [Chaetoceros tenuissimus]|uniref:Uncharacterized protein n=1 Tax=Chaetoceros tenuissimus TaxID=426638 RepID=A0AAD3H7M9_9STRA|nr:predicted protein [Chaetoceros tenuissimus]